VGKRDKDFEDGDGDEQEHEDESPLPVYHNGPVRRDSKSSQNSRSTQRTQDSNRTQSSSATKTSRQTRDTHRSNGSRSTAPKPRPPLLHAHDSTSTLVGSAYERKINDVESIKEKPDTTERLDQLRELMAKDTLDY
jgi:Xaa-Pro aminopeptidase